jgi:hypothetical protein
VPASSACCRQKGSEELRFTRKCLSQMPRCCHRVGVIEQTSDSPTFAADPGERETYTIRLRGHLGNDWAEWLGGSKVILNEAGLTVFETTALDQAGLHGLLKKVRDSGLTLVSLNPVRTKLKGDSK